MPRTDAPASAGSLAARYDEIRQLRAQADELEEALFREALQSCQWLELPAARALGIPRSSLRKLLNGRLRTLGEGAARKRAALGYGRGTKLSDVARGT
jgi:DNA-binding NtrC family response regulator